MLNPTKRRSVIGGILLIGSAVLLVASSFSAWYIISSTSSESALGASITHSGHAEFRLGDSYRYFETTSCTGMGSGCNSTVSESCHYLGGGSGACSFDFGRTGQLYLSIQILVIIGSISAVVGGFLAIHFANVQRFRKYVAIFGVLALLVSSIGPVTLLVLQPNALYDDYSSQGGRVQNGTGPYSSFIGSCVNTSGTCLTPGVYPRYSASWGPASGWYLALGATTMLLFGLLSLARDRRQESARVASWSCSHDDAEQFATESRTRL